MSTKWPMVRLGEVLTLYQEYIEAPEPRLYPKLSVKLYGKGVVLDAPADGLALKMQRHQLAKAGQVILSEIWGKKGAVGFVPAEGEGALCTSHFFLFDVKPDRIQPEFLDLFFKANYLEVQLNAEARGTTGYAAVRPKHFLACQVPLPPLAEQRWIVERIEELAAQIEQARRLRRDTVEEVGGLMDSAMNKILTQASNEAPWDFGPIPAFAEINPSRTGKLDLAPGDPVSFVPMKAVDDVTGTIARPETRSFAEVAKGYTWFREGDVIFARITPCMQNGKAAIARNLVNGTAFGSTEFHVIRPGPKLVSEWLYAIVRHKAFHDDAAAHFKGTAGQQRVPQSFLEQKLIPVPPLTEQRRMVAELDALQAQVDILKRFQAETATELDALLPSIVDRAFKGEL